MKNPRKKQAKGKPAPKKGTAAKKPVKKAAKRTAKSAPKKPAKKTVKNLVKNIAKKITKAKTSKVSKKAVKKPAKTLKPAKVALKPAKAALKPLKPAKAAKPVKPAKAPKPVKEAKPAKTAKTKAEPIVKQVKKCKKSLCKEPAFANGYCRYHYIASWKAEHIDKKVRKIKHLEKLINEIKKRFPAQYLDLIKADLLSDKVFRQVLKDMDLEEDVNDFEISDDTQRIIDSYSSLVDSDSNEEEY